ncbi:MAG: fibrillarin-like rRNA/tRNA 2'-O-methyltransferase [Thermoplasmatales archaeon]|nr:MAG: fibrillarin-like rRNA/tRNA 2'-O-methyltransferase [Thermoplasmatales archaeon]
MKTIKIEGVFKEKKRIFTENLDSCRGIKVYNEKLITYKKREYRSWNPYRSKLAAAILKGFIVNIKPDDYILYLGAATGTTVSHISDIIKKGIVYAVENSPVAVHDFIEVSRKRTNIIPILGDANHPDQYSHLVPSVDLIYQDISQRNQPEIFIANVSRYLKKKGNGILMLKARSIDVSLQPKQAYNLVCSKLEDYGLRVIKTIDLAPYEKDHAAIFVSI